MIINIERIRKAIFEGTRSEASERTGLSLRTIDGYRSKESSKSYRDWQGISLKTALEIMKRLEEREMNLEKIKEMLAEGKYLYFTSDTGASAERDATQSARNVLGDGELKVNHLGQYDGQDDEDLQIFDGDIVYCIKKIEEEAQ